LNHIRKLAGIHIWKFDPIENNTAAIKAGNRNFVGIRRNLALQFSPPFKYAKPLPNREDGLLKSGWGESV